MLAALVAVLALSRATFPEALARWEPFGQKAKKEIVARTLGPMEQQARVPDRTRMLVS